MKDHMLLWSMGDEKTDNAVEAYHEARGDNCTTSAERQAFINRYNERAPHIVHRQVDFRAQRDFAPTPPHKPRVVAYHTDPEEDEQAQTDQTNMLQIIHLPQHVNLCGPEAALPAREVEVDTAGSGRRARRVRLFESESLREVVLRAGADALVEVT